MNHLGGYMEEGDPHTFLPDIWGYISLKYQIRSVLDVGCGTGHALKWFRDYRKARAIGVEGSQDALDKSVVPLEILKKHDYTQGPLTLKGQYDLGISLEFLEHVEEKYIDNFMVTFTKCKYLLVSHATPGQDGHHHVNCQHKQYWIEIFKRYGMKELPDESEMFMQTNNLIKSPWCRDNLLFFKNEDY